jgi:membrane protein implicated in regulation of membrane protease activity
MLWMIFTAFIGIQLTDWTDWIHVVAFVVSSAAYAVMVYNFLTYCEKLERGEIAGPFLPPTLG